MAVTIAIGKIKPASSEAIPLFIKALKTQDYRDVTTIEALGNMGAVARPAIPALADLAKNHWNSDVRRKATVALQAIEPARNY